MYNSWKMCTTKRLKLLCWFILFSFIYFLSMASINTKKYSIKDTFQDFFSENLASDKQALIENDDYLITTTGCSIPNYLKTYKIVEAKYEGENSCGVRAVFVQKTSNEEIAFTIDETKMAGYTKGNNYSCCYQIGSPAIIDGKEDNTKLWYSNCTYFKNNHKGRLINEIITVTCSLESSKNVIYQDVYMILKKINRDTTGSDKILKKPYNVLILGMDSVSRARVYNSMPETIKYMLQNNWLDYRAYQKVGYNTFPNVMSLLTGRKMSTIYRTCTTMDQCNHLMIWSEFKKAGYVTATGEDDLKLPDTFANLGYKFPPTDHYIRPLFLTGERSYGNIICTKKRSSGKHIIDYASTFTETYKNENFFAFFWLNSYSHNLEHIPTLIDEYMVKIFSKLSETGVLQNTFVYFLSDHGYRSGEMRVPYESYYDERLPMFFLWVPTEFRKNNEYEYKNLKLNQYKLVTPYDVYLTLYNTLTISEISVNLNSEACPNCTSLFYNISSNRTCKEAGVDEKWCTCHEMAEISQQSKDIVTATNLAVVYVQNKVTHAKAINCMKCEMLNLKNIFRSHTYRDEHSNSTYYIIAFIMKPGDVAFEVTVVKHDEYFNLLPVNTISIYNKRGRCAIEPSDRAFCVCVPTCPKD